MTRLAAAARLALVSVVTSAGLLAGAPRVERGFPHLRHERLFPVCEGCHAGAAGGEATVLYPSPDLCARCHDGTRAKPVEWRAPAARQSNLRYSHREHLAHVLHAGDSVDCQSCHASGDRPSRMSVGGPKPASCTGCHAHSAPAHLDSTARCTACHAPLAHAPTITAERIARFPRPPSHEAPAFASAHGRGSARSAASCAVCHARQTCERCHANGGRLALVASLAPDERVAGLEKGRAPRYPVPSSHGASDWRWGHGAAARRTDASCDNCHTRPSCTGCHAGATGAAALTIATLPDVRPGGAPGVTLPRSASVVHPADIARRHATLASTGTLQCLQCHAQSTCAGCHAGTDSRTFHAANFVERHAAEVFSGSGSCESCHSTESFCRDCHARSGIASQSGMRAAFHTGQPMWVLSHGQAARTGMEACASCHRQADCVRCHSAVGGWRVNPHGPRFPASRLSSRNAASCGWCHAGSTPGGGG